MDILLVPRNPLLRDYFLSKFCRSDGIYISKDHPIGLVMVALYRPTKNKAKSLEKSSNAIRCVLPSCSETRAGINNYLYYDSESTSKINDVIQACFNMEFEKALIRGKRTGFSNIEIVYAFIADHSLNIDIYDMLAKRITRQNKKLNSERCKILLSLSENIYYEEDKRDILQDQ